VTGNKENLKELTFTDMLNFLLLATLVPIYHELIATIAVNTTLVF